MRLMEKLEKEFKDAKAAKAKLKEKIKKNVVRVQVAIPRELHDDLTRVFDKKGMTWQVALLGSINAMRDEMKKGE